MTQITLVALLELFSSHCALAKVADYPFSPAVLALAAETPKDEAVYEHLAREAFSRFILETPGFDYDKFGCFEEVLRILLYYDGRSFRGLVTLADLAYTNPDVSDSGVNALAWLTNFIESAKSPIALADVEMLKSKLAGYATNRTLAHNANACLRAIAAHRSASRKQ